MKPIPLLHDLGNDEYKLRIDNSSMDIIKSCPREALFYLFHRRGRGTNAALNMGSAVHNALEFLYRNGFSNDNLTIAYGLIDQHYNLFPVCDDWRTPEMVKQIIQKYFIEVGSRESFTILNTPDGNPFVEVPFEIQLGELNLNSTLPFSRGQLLSTEDPELLFIKKLHLNIIGKIDLAVHQMNGSWALDHKTSSIMGETFWAKWPISPQMKTYCWALWQITKEVPIGAIVNVLVTRRPTKTGTSIAFERQAFQYSSDLLLEWEKNALMTLSNFFSASIANQFPPNDSNCIRMYGKCPYYDVCALPQPSRFPYLYTSEYSPVQWDPTSE